MSITGWRKQHEAEEKCDRSKWNNQNNVKIIKTTATKTTHDNHQGNKTRKWKCCQQLLLQRYEQFRLCRVRRHRCRVAVRVCRRRIWFRLRPRSCPHRHCRRAGFVWSLVNVVNNVVVVLCRCCWRLIGECCSLHWLTVCAEKGVAVAVVMLLNAR